MDSLQGDAKGGQETTSEDGSTVCGEGGSGTSGLTSVSRRRSGGGAAARAARGTTGAGRHGRARGRVCAGCVVATLLLEGQPALELLVDGVASAVDARVVPVTAYETGDCLLVTAQLRGGERGSVGAVAGVLEGLLQIHERARLACGCWLLTLSQMLPLEATRPTPPQSSLQVLNWASQISERRSELNWLAGSEQQGMGVLYEVPLLMSWAEAPAMAEAAMSRVE